MAGKTRSIKEMRRQADAAEARGGDETVVEPKKKKVAAPKDPKKKPAVRAKRTKTKALVRKRLLWGVFSYSMKEEGRYPYAERAAADARADELTQKYKKPYFVQPIKEPIAAPPVEKVEKETAASKKAAAVADEE